MTLRVALLATAPPAAIGVDTALRGLGHDVVALVAVRVPPGRYGPHGPAFLFEVAPAGDLVFVSDMTRLAGILATFEPDLALCVSFPARIPDAALSVPRHGIVNGHPSLLPRHRGPNPMGWALRNGDRELGMTFHRMTSDIDGGPILGQMSIPVEDEDDAESLNAKFAAPAAELLPGVLARAASDDPGDPQPPGEGSYAGRFEADYVEVDWTHGAREIHNQTRAWSLAPPIDGRRGPLTELGGRRVRLLRTRLDDGAGGSPVACGDGTLWVLDAEPSEA